MYIQQLPPYNKRRETRRFRAWELNEKGLSMDEIAEALGVTLPTVKSWLRRAATGGIEALCTRKGQGNKPRLNASQRQHLLKLLIHGAKQYGFMNDVWTGKRVCMVIQREFDVIYTPNYIGSFLNKLGWRLYGSRSDPLRRKMRALQQWHPDLWDELDRTVGTETEPAGKNLP